MSAAKLTHYVQPLLEEAETVLCAARPQSQLSSLVELDDEKFVAAVRAAVVNSDPASRVMCLVAYANLNTFLAVFYHLRKTTGDVSLPSNLDEAIAFIGTEADQAENEVALRRTTWFQLAAGNR